MASIGGFFKWIGKNFFGLVPIIKKLLKNPIIKGIIVAKIGAKWVAIIMSLIDAADGLGDLAGTQKHAWVSDQLRNTKGLTTDMMPDAELDMYISGLVAAKRRPDRVKVLTEESV